MNGVLKTFVCTWRTALHLRLIPLWKEPTKIKAFRLINIMWGKTLTIILRTKLSWRRINGLISLKILNKLWATIITLKKKLKIRSLKMTIITKLWIIRHKSLNLIWISQFLMSLHKMNPNRIVWHQHKFSQNRLNQNKMSRQKKLNLSNRLN